MGVSQNYGYHFKGPHNKDYSILGSILGSPYLEKLPYTHHYQVGGPKVNYPSEWLFAKAPCSRHGAQKHPVVEEIDVEVASLSVEPPPTLRPSYLHVVSRQYGNIIYKNYVGTILPSSLLTTIQWMPASFQIFPIGPATSSPSYIMAWKIAKWQSPSRPKQSGKNKHVGRNE